MNEEIVEEIIRATPTIHIGFSGIGGVGKTEILNGLAPILEKYDIKIVPSIMFTMMQKYNLENEWDILTKLTTQETRDFQLRCFYKKVEIEEKYKDINFITDRTLFDHFSYILSHTSPAWITDLLYEKLHNLLQQSANIYTHVFFYPQNVFQYINSEKNRIPYKLYHCITNLLIENTLKTYYKNYISIITFDKTLRVKFISSIIENFMYNTV